MSEKPDRTTPRGGEASPVQSNATTDALAPTVCYSETSTDAAAPAAPPGYELVEELGSGGMGSVYRAREVALNRHVALKILHTRFPINGVVARRFKDEAAITGQLQHPGIPPIHQIGALLDGRPFLAMKLIRGDTLEEQLKERKTPEEGRGRFLAVFEQVCQAVGYAHAHRVIHRDLKPANVMVGAFGEVQVMDWGLAKTLTGGTDGAVAAEEHDSLEIGSLSIRDLDTATLAGSILGTPAYMPPEQAGGSIEKIDTRSDVFGLGAILCVILTGRAPYADKDLEVVRLMSIRGELSDGLARLDASGAEPELIALCMKCLSLEPAARPNDGGEVAAAVAAFRTHAEERARQAEIERARAEVAVGEQRKRRKVQAALGLTFTLLVLLGSAFTWRSKQERLAREAEERERQAFAERDVNLAVEAAVARYAQARGADSDLALWAEARAAALQAHERSTEAPPGVRRRIKGLIDEIEQTERNRRLVAALLEIQASMGDQLMVEGAQDFPGADARYEQAFREYGTDLFQISADAGASLLRTLGSTRTMELAAALDDWAYVRSFGPTGDVSLAHLLRVTRRLDPDPLRNLIRDAITARDRPTLKAIGDSLDPSRQPVQTVNLIAVFINLFGGANVYHPDTVDYLRRAHPHHPGDFQINHNLAWTCNRLGRHEEALVYSVSAIAIRPRSAAAWQDRAIALRGLGRHAEAADAFRRVISIAPQTASACMGLGRALIECGDRPGAIAAWRQAVSSWKHAIESRPRPSYRQGLRSTHILLGDALRAEGDLKGAVAEFVNAIALFPLEPSAYAMLADALMARGMP